jgi:hypothetical protein
MSSWLKKKVMESAVVITVLMIEVGIGVLLLSISDSLF